MHKKMEAEAAWHRGNKVAEAGCAGLGNLAYEPSVHRGVSAGDSDSSREETLEEAWTRGRCTNGGREFGLKGGGKEEKKDPRDAEK